MIYFWLYIQSLFKFKYSALFIFFLFPYAQAMAQGNLLINPKRIVFEEQKRSEEINLVNTGNDTARYAVSFIQFKMKTDGSFEKITAPDSGQYFADKNLRIFPRMVTLGPTEAQVVKIQVSQASMLLPGEYRSHLYLRAIPKENPLEEKLFEKDTSNVSVRLTPIFGLSIPVIIRIGKSTAQVSLSNLKVETLADSSTILHARFNRSGNMSVYGDLTVEHVSDEGKRTRVGLVKGISVYTPNDIRNFKIKLNNEAGVNYRSGTLNAVYTRPVEEKSEKMASAELILNWSVFTPI